jgi:hypothetical protein
LTGPAPSTLTGLELGGGPSDPPAAPWGLGAGCGGDGDRARPGPAGLSPRASEGSREDANEAAAVVAVAVVPGDNPAKKRGRAYGRMKRPGVEAVGKRVSTKGSTTVLMP